MAAPARSGEVKQLAEYHQTLMKLRLEGGLDGIELGPVLGQGSFGRVYKGAMFEPDTQCALQPGCVWTQHMARVTEHAAGHVL